MNRFDRMYLILLCINDNAKKSVTRDNQFRQFEDENVWFMSIQMFVPFLLAGFGMVAASMLLDVVQVIFNMFNLIEMHIICIC